MVTPAMNIYEISKTISAARGALKFYGVKGQIRAPRVVSQGAILRLLTNNSPLSAKEVANEMGFTSGSAYFHLNALEKKGMVKRIPVPVNELPPTIVRLISENKRTNTWCRWAINL